MKHATTCVSDDDLLHYCNEEISSDKEAIVEQHLLTCSECQDRIRAYETEDPFWRTILSAISAPAPSVPEAPEELYERHSTLRSTDSTNQGLATFDFLGAPQQAGELGRIGPYRILECLGRGGMGIVFRAEETALCREVAVKVMLPKYAGDPEAKERFLREARSAATIEHDNIVPIYFVGEERGVPFLAMQLLKGASLDDWIRQQRSHAERPTPVDAILKIGEGIARGLQAAHQHGLIHRDIKPANIWLDAKADDRVRLLDFGLARPLHPGDENKLSQSGMIVGTPAYMSPEQARGDKVDGRSDLFSLGCVLYELTAGRRAFAGKDPLAILSRLAVEQPAPPAQINPQIPAKLSDLVVRLLAKDPSERIGSAGEVVRYIENLQGTFNLTPEKFAPLAPVRSRRPVYWAAALAVLAFGLWIAGSTLIRIQTKSGDFEVEIDPDQIEAMVKNNAVTLFDREKKRSFTVMAKDGKIEIVDPDNGVQILTDNISITRGQKMILRVRLIPRPPDQKPPPPLQPEVEPDAAFPPFDAVRAGIHQDEWAKYLNVLKEIHSISGLKMILIPPAGGKILGQPWRMSKYEVTQAQFMRATGYNPSRFPGANATAADLRSFPVENVNWFMAVEFCNRLSEIEKLRPYYELNVIKREGHEIADAEVKILGGDGYHLPTVEQWEYACRAGTKTRFWCGDRDEDLGKYEWYEDNSGGQMHKVGEKPANPFGLHDMHGNVWEWCWDLYEKGAVERVHRSGWINSAKHCEAGMRFRAHPYTSQGSYGIRVAHFIIPKS